MPNNVKLAVARAKVENQLVELMLKTQTTNVYLEDGSTTLASRLADIATSLSAKADSSQVATDISTAISGLIDGAPETYDTLKEISDYIDAHEDVVNALNAAIGDKVSKETGKGLSANDFTDALKNKLDAIAAGAEVNQNAFSKVQIGDTLVEASGKTDTVTFVAGDNVTLTPNTTNKSVTVGVTIPTITIDSALSDVSENAVQNKVVKAAIDAVQADVDATPDVFIQASQPSTMKNNDIWLQIIEEEPANNNSQEPSSNDDPQEP